MHGVAEHSLESGMFPRAFPIYVYVSKLAQLENISKVMRTSPLPWGQISQSVNELTSGTVVHIFLLPSVINSSEFHGIISPHSLYSKYTVLPVLRAILCTSLSNNDSKTLMYF